MQDVPERGQKTPRYKVLGIDFLLADAQQAVNEVQMHGGMLVAPASTSLVYLRDRGEAYRQAMTGADFAIADSGMMVLLCRWLRGATLPRVSGLRYLKHLLPTTSMQTLGGAFWILPSTAAMEHARNWLPSQGVPVRVDDCYVAPFYDRQRIEDPELLDTISAKRPANIVVALSGGVSEPLGMYLRDRCGYRPAIHCIGAALGFLTGDQQPIPDWADRFYLGWFLRWCSQPKALTSRMLRAFELPWLIWKYGQHLPPPVR